MDICTDLPYLVVVASCEGIKYRRTKGQRSLRTPVILDRAANENVWALRDFRYAGDSTELLDLLSAYIANSVSALLLKHSTDTINAPAASAASTAIPRSVRIRD